MGNLLAAVIAFGLAGSAIGQTGGAKEYVFELAKWRQSQEDELKADEGFLSVAGLCWLKEGDNSIGTDEASTVRLPAGAGPAHAGVITLHGDKVTMLVNDGVFVQQFGAASPQTKAFELALDATRAKIGSTTFMAIHRGSRIGIRMWDKSCKGYTEFKGQKWYAPNPRYIVKAKFVPYDPPKMVNITNVLGDVQPVPTVGYVEFTMGGKVCRLDAQGSGSGLFMNFKDLTSGNTTYPAGRFLDSPKPVDGIVMIDFNKATNPPCAFTAFATCPLPPRQNYLEVAIPAGEKTHHPVE
jgi:uncharacterized protein (DUF1684 family)